MSNHLQDSAAVTSSAVPPTVSSAVRTPAGSVGTRATAAAGPAVAAAAAATVQPAAAARLACSSPPHWSPSNPAGTELHHSHRTHYEGP